MGFPWSLEAHILCVWLCAGVHEYEMQQEKTNNYRGRDNWLSDKAVYGFVGNFMSALREVIPFDRRRIYSINAVNGHLVHCDGGWKTPANIPTRAETVLPDYILPGEFGEFGFRAVLEATIALVTAGGNNDTPEYRDSLQRWKKYFPEVEIPAALSTVQETARSTVRETAQSTVQ